MSTYVVNGHMLQQQMQSLTPKLADMSFDTQTLDNKSYYIHIL